MSDILHTTDKLWKHKIQGLILWTLKKCKFLFYFLKCDIGIIILHRDDSGS